MLKKWTNAVYILLELSVNAQHDSLEIHPYLLHLSIVYSFVTAEQYSTIQMYHNLFNHSCPKTHLMI